MIRRHGRTTVLTIAAGAAVALVAGCGTTDTTAAAPEVRTANVASMSTTTVPPTTTTTTPPPPSTTAEAPVARPVADQGTTKRRPKKPVPKPAKPVKAPCGVEADVCVDLSANKAWLMSDGVVTYGPVPITSGMKGYRTPPGTFRVQWKNRHHRSRAFNNAPMPYSVFFHNGMAFHEGSLRAQSHGCIHLSRTAAQRFFSALSVGEVVQIVR